MNWETIYCRNWDWAVYIKRQTISEIRAKFTILSTQWCLLYALHSSPWSCANITMHHRKKLTQKKTKGLAACMRKIMINDNDVPEKSEKISNMSDFDDESSSSILTNSMLSKDNLCKK